MFIQKIDAQKPAGQLQSCSLMAVFLSQEDVD